jgi:hypothetical protein
MGESSQAPAISPSNQVDANEAVEGNGLSIRQSSAKAPTDDKKLNELLKVFQSQLVSQQRQLDLLRGLTKPQEPPAPTPTPINEDFERAVQWRTEKAQVGCI